MNNLAYLDLTTILSAIKQQRIPYDEIDFKILLYIWKKRKTYSLDKKLQKITNLKERQLRQRLSALSLNKFLSVNEEKVGKQRTNFYQLQ